MRWGELATVGMIIGGTYGSDWAFRLVLLTMLALIFTQLQHLSRLYVLR